MALVLSGLFDHEATAAIIYPPEPAGGREMVYKYAKATLQAESGFLHGFQIENLTIAEPYRVYYVREELRAGRNPSEIGTLIFCMHLSTVVKHLKRLVLDGVSISAKSLDRKVNLEEGDLIQEARN